MDIVCDTSSLIKLRKAGVLLVLPQIFNRIVIPHAVFDECEKQEAEILELVHQGKISVEAVGNELGLVLGAGERSVINLAVHDQYSLVLLDDKKALKKMKTFGIRAFKFFDVLLIAKQKGLIESVGSCLNAILDAGDGIEDEVIEKILKLAGEV